MIALLTVGFILLCQLPNAVNIFQPWKSLDNSSWIAEVKSREDKLAAAREAGDIDQKQYEQQMSDLSAESRRASGRLTSVWRIKSSMALL